MGAWASRVRHKRSCWRRSYHLHMPAGRREYLARFDPRVEPKVADHYYSAFTRDAVRFSRFDALVLFAMTAVCEELMDKHLSAG